MKWAGCRHFLQAGPARAHPRHSGLQEGCTPPHQVQTPGHINSVGRNRGWEPSILPLAGEISIPHGFCRITNSAKTGGLGLAATVSPEPECGQPRSWWRDEKGKGWPGWGPTSTGEPMGAPRLLLQLQEPAESHLSPLHVPPSLHTCDPVKLSQEPRPQCLCIF